MILADDMGWADLGCDGSKIDTPNVDRLAREGVKLTRFYSSGPMCSPTRAALLTGRYPHSVGMPELASPTVRGNVPVLALDHDAITVPEALKPAGYHSVMLGKWHLGDAKPNWPRTHGFDEFWGSIIGTPMYWQTKATYHNKNPIQAANVKPAADHEIHGIPILPLLTGGAFARNGALCWENQQNAAIVLGEWKLVQSQPCSAADGQRKLPVEVEGAV